jgi:hypothetical protein
MTIATDIIYGRMPDLAAITEAGETLDDIDEFGFTPLIECVIAKRPDVAEALLNAGADINAVDVTGRTPIHWAVYQTDLEMARLLLSRGANANAYTSDGLSVLVYPILRRADALKHLLYQHGAKLDFAQDFIHAKLLGHRYSLQGDVDILNAKGEFIEIDYEGFILEFTVALVRDALYRFISSFSTRHLRGHFQYVYPIMDAFEDAGHLLQLQHVRNFTEAHHQFLSQVLQAPMQILPAASKGHAIGFVHAGQWWAKVDRGEHSQKEGSVNIYRITRPQAYNEKFLQLFLYQRQPRAFFHETINTLLGLVPYAKLPIPPQTVGNCSWANIQALIPAAYYIQQLAHVEGQGSEAAMSMFESWVTWDQDRALDECLHRFYNASFARKASLAAILAAVLFQACDASVTHDVERAEKILTVLALPEYRYILNSYLEAYCVKRLSRRGNNLLKLLDDCGVNPNIGVNPIATGLKKRRSPD